MLKLIHPDTCGCSSFISTTVLSTLQMIDICLLFFFCHYKQCCNDHFNTFLFVPMTKFFWNRYLQSGIARFHGMSISYFNWYTQTAFQNVSNHYSTFCFQPCNILFPASHIPLLCQDHTHLQVAKFNRHSYHFSWPTIQHIQPLMAL